LRIGDRERIERDLARHRQMAEAGFPLATILSEGTSDGQSYFIESSLGEKHLGARFADDIEQTGAIRPELFEKFVLVVEKFARAQLNTRDVGNQISGLEAGILLSKLLEEMPEHSSSITERFNQAQNKLKELPLVLTHGDCNPNNLYPEGIIDLEDSFQGPYGYDLVSAIEHINSFPDSREYEYFAKYRFTPEQKKQFYDRLDAISVESGLLPLSEYAEDLEYCRAVWLAADIPRTPKLQKFRFDALVNRFLRA